MDRALRLDGVDIAKFRMRDLRQSFAVVTQDAFLVEGSILDNINLGRADATSDEIVTTAMLAGCRGLISEMPAGCQTNIGDRGAKLSGGQRQLVTIARAVLRLAAILILDEATSDLDDETEAGLFERLTPFFAGRTVIIITHSVRAARLADRINVMSGGRVIEAGAHEELMGADGAYATLWRMQAQPPSAPPDAPYDAPAGHVLLEGSVP